MRRSILTAAVIAVAVAAPVVSFAQQDANVERGFAPEKLYQFGDLDQVNLFNGNLSLTLPIGPTYPVGGSLSYGLTLVYNSKIWDLYSGPEVVNGPPVPFAELRPHDNAGIGWRLTLGQLIGSTDPNNVSGLSYVGPDGGEHGFTHANLHSGGPTMADTWYARDGSYLRLKRLSGTVSEVESGDGTIRRFTRATASSPFEVTQIRDRFGNDLVVTQLVSPVRWKLDDGHRVHWVYFKTVANREVVDRVELRSFGGTTAAYTFNYSASSIQEHCGDLHSKTPANRLVPLLTSVSLPADAGSFQMSGSGDYYSTCQDGGTTIVDLPGVLHRLRLPTLGSIEWTYQTHTYPARGIFTPGEPSLETVETLGVKTKRVLDAAGSCVTLDGVGCQWTYAAGQSGSMPNLERSMRVTHPTGDETVYHFSLISALSTSAWTGWEYALPYKKTSPGGPGEFLSQEIFDGTAAGGTKKRSIYVGYEHDVLPGSTGSPQNWYNSNRRVVREKTVYHDDGNREATIVYSDFDGLGHYRRRVTGGGFDAGNVRTDLTQFNPGQGIFSVNQATNVQSGGYTPWGGSSPWVLGSSTETWSQEGGSTVKTQTCYPGQNGALGWTRAYKSHSAPQAVDILTYLTRDGQGNVIREEHFGGDSGGLPATAQNGTCTLSGLPTSDVRIDHTYQSGSRWASQYVRADGSAMSFYSLNLAIDASTGLPANSTDPSGITTTFEYDGLGRLTWSKPGTQHDAWTEYAHLKATSSAALARVAIRRRANGSKTGAVRAEAEIGFDAFGRVSQDRKKLPGGAWTTVGTRYNSLGRVFDVSERMAGTPSKSTKYLDYDPFGRPRTIRPPDSVSPGFPHDVTLSYAGARTVTREVGVGTGPFSGGSVTESRQAVTEIYDRQGRLWRVREPGVAGASATDTTYAYDAGHRLVQVAMAPQGGATAQTRSFAYDGRGFLNWENHPEKTANVRGLGHDVDYEAYDALGRAGRRVDGASDLTFALDRAGRLTQVRETGGGQRVLKTFAYGTSNGAGNWKNEKLEASRRYNYIVLGTAPVTVEIAETYTYGGKGGRMSQRDLAAWVGGAATEGFTQGWTYDDLGAAVSTAYPRCAQTGSHPFPACTAPAQAPRSVSATYTDGVLTAIPGYTGTVTGQAAGTGISYHPAGLLSQIAHANGVTDTQTLDPTGRSRPGSLGSALGAATRWASGAYSYDGSGNITEMGTSWFTYDELSRIETATVWTGPVGGGTQKQQTYTFDRYGNLTAIAGTPDPGRSTPTSSSTNRLTGATYDAAGNVTGWNGAVHEWDAFQMMWRYQSGAENWLYLYNADDERVWSFKIGANWSRWTLRGLGNEVLREYVNNAGVWTVDRDYVYRGGQLLAAETPQGRRHFHLDHLGTPRLITDAAGAQVAFHTYYPFGEEATAFNLDAERMKFTGHERDLGSTAGAGDDLDYMHARHCSPLTGRFLAVDPATQRRAHTRPQAWNRYAYGRGNPLNLIDPDGREVVPPTDRRTRKAVGKFLSTGAGRAAYEALERAPGVYKFSVTNSRLTPVEQLQLRAGNTVTKVGGHFTPNYVVAEGKVQWISGGTLTIDYGVVDRAADRPYAGKHGDPALLAHEVGHAVNYEENPEGFVGLTYDEQEENADELRDEVVEQLEEQRQPPRRLRRHFGEDPFTGTGFCSADNICH